MPGFSLILDFGLLEGRVLHKGVWVATLLGTLLGVQDYKTVTFQGWDNSSLGAKGVNNKLQICQIFCVAIPLSFFLMVTWNEHCLFIFPDGSRAVYLTVTGLPTMNELPETILVCTSNGQTVYGPQLSVNLGWPQLTRTVTFWSVSWMISEGQLNITGASLSERRNGMITINTNRQTNKPLLF